MKKTLCILLSLILLISSLAGVLAATISAATPSVITQDFETGFYENISGSGIVRDPDNLGSKTIWGTATRETTGGKTNTYVTVKDTGKWVQYVTNTAETGRLLANATYDVTIKYRLRRSSTNMSGTAVPIYFWAWDKDPSGSSIASSPANATNGVYLPYNADEESWQTVTIKNLKRFDTDGVLRVQVPSVVGHTDAGNHMLVDFDEIVFTEVVQTEFVQDFEKGFTTKGGSNQILRDPDNLLDTDASCWCETATEGENRFLRATTTGKTIPYLTNKAETGLLRTDGSKYMLQFKYRINIKEGNDTTQPVQLLFAPQNGGSLDWNNIGKDGESQKSGIKLYYDAAKETTWRTATIYNFLRTDTDGYLKLYVADKPSGSTTVMNVELDDFVFTEMQTSKTVSVSKTGAGSVKVDKKTVALGQTVTFTATPAKGQSFFGWFDKDDNQIADATKLTYSVKYTGGEVLDLVAKFSPGALQDFEGGLPIDVFNPARDPDNLDNPDKQCWGATAKKEDGNTYINVTGFTGGDKWFTYITNKAETGLLATDGTKYQVTFRYRIKKANATDTTKPITVAINPQGGVLEDVTSKTSLNYDADADASGEWKTATIFNFARKADDNGYLRIRMSSTQNYELDLDDFCFTPITLRDEKDELSEWAIYDWTDRGNHIGPSGTDNLSGGWANISYNLDPAFCNEGEDYSLAIKALSQYTATTFAVTPNTDYYISLDYYAPDNTYMDSKGQPQQNRKNAGYQIGSVGVVSVDGRYYYNSEDMLSFTSSDRSFTGNYANRATNYLTTVNGGADGWQRMQIPFHSGEETEVAFVLTSAAQYLYISDITLHTGTFDVPGPGTPAASRIVDFDTFGADVKLQQADRMEIAKVKGKDGTESNALHLFRGIYDTPTLLNANTAYNADTDPVFTFAVKENCVYKVTFKVKLAVDYDFKPQDLDGDGKNEGLWVAVYQHYSGYPAGAQNKSMGILHSMKQGEWLQFTYYLETMDQQDVFSFTMNAGRITPEMWIDDITVTETDYAVFSGHTLSQEQIISFDDYAVNSENSERIYVENNAPTKDGKQNNSALYIPAGTHSGSVCLNPTAARAGKDPVYSLPCKPGTLYTLSYWLYVTPDQQTGVSWFKFYYFYVNKTPWDANNDSTAQGLLDATGMRERGEWVKFETTFKTAADQNSVCLTFNAQSKMPEMWLDDIALAEVLPGGLENNSEYRYSAEMYNELSTDMLRDIAAGKSGVYKLPIAAMTRYTFAATVGSTKQSASRLFLSQDGVAPMEPSDPASGAVMIAKADGTTTRYAFRFVSDRSGYVYLVIQNKDGALQIEAPQLFQTYSLSTAQPMGYAEAPGIGLKPPKVLTALRVFGTTDTQAAEAPATGDTVEVLPALLSLLLALGVVLATRLAVGRKGEKTHA